EAVTLAGIRKGRARVEDFVDKVVVSGAVKLVCPGLHGVVEVAAARLPVLGRIVRNLNRYFLDSVQARLRHLVVLAMLAVGGVLGGHARFGVFGFHLGAGYHRSGRIDDGTRNGSAIALCEYGYAE